MKKLTIIAVALLSIIPIQAHADITNTNIAIIDTGFDPSVTQFNGKIVDEVCFTISCPNKQVFQEGTGAASLTSSQLLVKDALHGTQMLSASITTNPNTNYVYIRAYGIVGTVLASPSDSDFINILNWIYANKDRLHIGAVSFSAARNITTACPSTTSGALAMISTVNQLNASGIPVISAAGNNYDYAHVAFPACLSPVIAVGSIDAYGHALYSNAGTDLDFDAMGTMTVSNGGTAKIQSVGTSLAVQVFAASWVAIKQAKPSLTYSQEYALIQSTETFSNNIHVKGVPTLNLAGALK
jgi:hypothetical protein